MLKITTEQKNKGVELGRKLGQSKMWINEKGEYFTNENFASLSVGNDKEKVGVIEVTAEAVKEDKTNELGTATEIIAAIEAAADAEAVQAIIDAENEGKKRKTVLDAGAKKLETFNA
jgi:hypothetical protein